MAENQFSKFLGFLLAKITYFGTVSLHKISLMIGTRTFFGPELTMFRFISTSLVDSRNNIVALIAALHAILTHKSLTSMIGTFSNSSPFSTVFVEVCTIWHWTCENQHWQIESKTCNQL